MLIKRGDIFYADLSPIIGSEQDGIRPVLVIQNDTGNKYSPTVITVPISSKRKQPSGPCSSFGNGSTAEGINDPDGADKNVRPQTAEKYLGSLDNEIMDKVNEALK